MRLNRYLALVGIADIIVLLLVLPGVVLAGLLVAVIFFGMDLLDLEGSAEGSGGLLLDVNLNLLVVLLGKVNQISRLFALVALVGDDLEVGLQLGVGLLIAAARVRAAVLAPFGLVDLEFEGDPDQLVGLGVVPASGAAVRLVASVALLVDD